MLIDSEAILERKQDMSILVDELFEKASIWNSTSIPEHDWSRIKQVDFQQLSNSENLTKLDREKEELYKQMRSCGCINCPEILMHYNMIHREKILKQQLADLAHSLSDQNLELLPGF